MLKKSITYEDLNGESVTEDFFFHLSKADLVEMEVEHPGGLGAYLKRIVESEDGKAIISEFKSLILKSYGEKSEDGKRFIKDWQKTEEFQQSEAYSALFLELCTDAGAGAAFVNGIVPAGLKDDVAKLAATEEPPVPHPSDPAAQPQQGNLGRNVFEGEDTGPVETRVLSKSEIEEMDADELQSGLASGRFTIGAALS